MFEIIVEPRAKFEIENAFNYYCLEVSDIVGLKFLEDFYESFQILEINPYFQKRYLSYRVFPFSRFPYIFIYYISEEEKKVYIESVFHTSQDPKNYP